MSLSHEIEPVNQVLIFHLSGKIISEFETTELEKDFGRLLNQNLNQVIIDVEKLTHINSTGISMLIKMITKTRILGGDMVITGLSGNVAKIFDIAKLDEVFTLYDKQEEALIHFNKNEG
jgi:anti-anti-sigma factor